MRIRYGVLLFLLILVNYCVYASDQALWIVKPEEMKKVLPHFSEKDIATFLVKREGTKPNSQMITRGIQTVVENGYTYQLTPSGFKPISGKERGKSAASDLPVPCALVIGSWKEQPIKDGENANILGKNGTFVIDDSNQELHIPLVEATQEALSYYNARLLKNGDRLTFSLTHNFPISAMEVGSEYVDEYLMKEGGGFYFEYHNQPHLHMPMDTNARGFYLLGKKVAEKKYHFTAFSIPYGTAIFTNKNVIHCDAGLVGNYLVGYTIAKEYSTVLLRSSKGERVKVVGKE